jgi:hypothetical protein
VYDLDEEGMAYISCAGSGEVVQRELRVQSLKGEKFLDGNFTVVGQHGLLPHWRLCPPLSGVLYV